MLYKQSDMKEKDIFGVEIYKDGFQIIRSQDFTFFNSYISL